jgi:aspartate aminotransferase, cytoplasmic
MAPASTSHTSSSSSSSSSLSRLQSIARQMAPLSTTSFPAEAVPQAPEDPLFGLMRAYKADTSPNKVDLVSRSPWHSPPHVEWAFITWDPVSLTSFLQGIGAYRDNTGKPWVLPVVKKVRVFHLHSPMIFLPGVSRPNSRQSQKLAQAPAPELWELAWNAGLEPRMAAPTPLVIAPPQWKSLVAEWLAFVTNNSCNRRTT